MKYDYSIGEQVLILCRHVPGTGIEIPPGTEGTIVRYNPGSNLYYRVKYGGLGPEEQNWFFSSDDLQSVKKDHPMVEPLFDLHDMELAEIMIEEMK